MKIIPIKYSYEYLSDANLTKMTESLECLDGILQKLYSELDSHIQTMKGLVETMDGFDINGYENQMQIIQNGISDLTGVGDSFELITTMGQSVGFALDRYRQVQTQVDNLEQQVIQLENRIRNHPRISSLSEAEKDNLFAKYTPPTGTQEKKDTPTNQVLELPDYSNLFVYIYFHQFGTSNLRTYMAERLQLKLFYIMLTHQFGIPI